MSKVFSAQIGGTVFRDQQQSSENGSWVTALSRAHRQDTAFCMCSDSGPVKIIIKHYARESTASHYGLARWPGTGLSHDPLCQFFDDEFGTGAAGDSLPAFDDLPDGKIRAHLATGLSVAKPGAAAIERAAPSAQSNRNTRARASEITLLQKLWRMSSLNVYYGTPRNWFGAVYALVRAAERIVVSKAGTTLADYLLIGSGQADRMANEHNQNVLAWCAQNPTRLFVVGRLRKFDTSKTRLLLPLQEFNGFPKVLVRAEQLASLVDPRPLFGNLLADKSGHVVVIACIEPDGKDWWKLISIAGLATTKNMVPVDSSYEIEFEKYLTDQARKFIKPMVVGEVGEDQNRPDFILLDTSPRVRCEVWGMRTDDYLAGKAQRIAAYARRGQDLVSWSANPREDFPALPPPTLPRKS